MALVFNGNAECRARHTAPPPEWDHIHFDVHCGRCGQVLNGVLGHYCPQCSLPLDWHDVLPVEMLRCPACQYNLLGLREQRCPECGRPFEWDEILHLARSGSLNLFERQWMRYPVLSLFKTTWLALCRPFKLWSAYDVHDPPQLPPLLILVAIQCALFVWGWPAFGVFAKWFMDHLSVWNGSRQTFVYNLRFSYRDLTFLGYWYVATFLSFQIFILSKRRFRVRWQQTLRIFAHATVPVALAPMMWCVIEMLMDVGLLMKPGLRWRNSDYWLAGQIMLFGSIVLSCIYVWIGYARYLKMPRGWGIAGMGVILGHCAARWTMIMWY